MESVIVFTKNNKLTPNSQKSKIITNLKKAEKIINDDFYQNHLDYKNLIKSDIYNINGESLRKIFNINYVITKEIPFSSQIKLIALIPDKALKTEKSRSILPNTYSKNDVIYNLQRLSMLCLSFQNPDPMNFYKCLQDRLHQPYRNEIIPGLNDLLSVNPLDIPGLLGMCLSGAGPSIVAFIICNEIIIGDKLCKLYKEKSNNNCNYLLIQLFNKLIFSSEIVPLSKYSEIHL